MSSHDSVQKDEILSFAEEITFPKHVVQSYKESSDDNRIQRQLEQYDFKNYKGVDADRARLKYSTKEINQVVVGQNLKGSKRLNLATGQPSQEVNYKEWIQESKDLDSLLTSQ